MMRQDELEVMRRTLGARDCPDLRKINHDIIEEAIHHSRICYISIWTGGSYS
jgi:hypothetical protein